MERYHGKEILVLGLGISGKAAARFLLDQGAHVYGVDQNATLLQHDPEIQSLRRKGLKLLPDSDSLSCEISLVVLSPGIPTTHPICLWAKQRNITLIGEVELACRHINSPLLAVTGTNGKTTVTLLVGHVLRHAGIRAKVLGNIGIPLCAEMDLSEDEVIVCELSSYQLETLSSKNIDCAVILNITPDHLDRYRSMDAYAKAKIHLQTCMKYPENLCVEESVLREYEGYFTQKPKTFGFSSGCDIRWDGRDIYVKENIELFLPECYRGKFTHDVENVMAAYFLCRSRGVSGELFVEALRSFRKPPHRIEFVKNVRGIAFYDDSKGTNIDAVIRAVDSLKGQVVLIAGGVAKGCSFASWAGHFRDKVKHICAIGEAKEQLFKELSEAVSVEKCASLPEAVNKAFALARQGESVLLSPGCASFDMFKNYEHRGHCFREHVFALEE